jgi:CHAT domain-containing protein
MLDEVVSFPGALLQAGVAGVVATQAKVDDRAAMLLVHRFFERFRAGVAPARALAEAQAWLRTSTNAQLQGDVPRYHPLPTHISSAELQKWGREHPFAHPAAWAPFSYTGA